MKKSHIIGGIIIIIAIIAVVLISKSMHSSTPADSAANPAVSNSDGTTTYTESDFGFSLKFPSTWLLEDQLTAQTCCLFIAHITTATTTALNASGTPVEKVTQTELIKLQIGQYDKRVQDPFSTTTRQVTMNGQQIYTGYTSNGEYFLVPRDANTGIGIAEFRYTDTPQADIDAIQKVVGSFKYVGEPKAVMSTATTTKAAATTTKK